jgi:hypothetical protein
MRNNPLFRASPAFFAAFLVAACVQPHPMPPRDGAAGPAPDAGGPPQGVAVAQPGAGDCAPDPAAVRAIQALFARARTATAAHAVNDAVADLGAILGFPDINHSHFNAIFLRGAVHQAAGNKLAAREDLNAIFAFPGNSTAHGPVFFLREVLRAGESAEAAEARLTRDIHDSENDVAVFLASANDTSERGLGKNRTPRPPAGAAGDDAVDALRERASRNAGALLARGLARAQSGRLADSVQDFRAASGHRGATPGQKAEAVFFLATALGVLGDADGEFAGYSKIHKEASLPPDLRPPATLLRIMASGHSGGVDKTIPQFDRLLLDTSTAPASRPSLHFLRGLAAGRVGEMRAAMEDFYHVLTDPAAPPALVVLVRRHFHDPPLPVAVPF